MTKRTSHLVLDALSLASDAVVLADGSLWSHAATLGTRVKGTAFTIDRTMIENFLRVFSTGYPQKVPVDYEHGTANGAANLGQPVPKAGDVVELRGVYAAADFSGDLKAAAEKLSEKAGRALNDARNLGLWMRWRPTPRALGMIKGGEYSELSICYDEDYPNKADGVGQGPALLSVALTNTPFLDDMLPVAASRSRDGGGGPDDPATSREDKRMSDRAKTMLSLVAAIAGAGVTSEEEAVTVLQQLQPEVAKLRTFQKDVGAAIEETDPIKAVAKILQLKADTAKHATELATAKQAKIDADVAATMTKHEKRLTPATKAFFEKQLRGELAQGVALDKSETVKAIESMPVHGITEQRSGGDLGGANADDDVKLDAKARELQQSNPRIKALSEKDPHEGYKAALLEAERQLATTTA